MTNKKTLIKSIAIEAIMFLVYAFFAVNWIAGSTLTPNILKAFNLEGANSVSLINNVVTIAKILGNLVVATIFAKLFPKKLLGLGTLLIPAGALINALLSILVAKKSTKRVPTSKVAGNLTTAIVFF